MKRLSRYLLVICCLTLCLTLCLGGCGDNSTETGGTTSDDTFPDNDPSDNIRYRKTIGVGQLDSMPMPDGTVTAVLSDKTVIELVSSSTNEKGVYTVRGLKEGTSVVSFIGSDGATVVERHEYTIREEDTVRIGEGELVSGITVDKTRAEIYRDDTLVTYTVTTSADVDRLELVQVMHTYKMFLFDDLIEEEAREDKDLIIFELDKLIIDETSLTEELVENEELGTRYSATRSANGDTVTWTVKWDLGYTAVRFIRIKAFDTDANTEQTNYVKLDFVYPVVTNDDKGFADVVELFVKSNSDRPLIFKVDDGSQGAFNGADSIFRGVGTNFADRFKDSAIYGGNSVKYVTNYLPITAYDIQGFKNKWESYVEQFGEKNILCDPGYNYGYTLGFYYPISDELRAVIAYQNGWEIDEELFPYAHSILERSSAVLDEIITDEMTDFEKEKAIYTWMYEQGMNGFINGWTLPPEGVEESMVLKTAYGVLNNYGGDCMAWSGTFYTLCNMAGLDCVTVDVKAAGGGAVEDFSPDHRINMIRLGDEYYFVEAFWSWQKEDPSDGTYRYMNMTTEKAAMLYTWAAEDKGGPFACDYDGYLADEQTGELLKKDQPN